MSRTTHATRAMLEEGLARVDAGVRSARVSLMVARLGEDRRREVVSRTVVTKDGGLGGDAWERKLPLNPDAQLAVMCTPVAELIAHHQPLTTFGDNLFFDFDLSAAHLPAGSRLRVGEAILEVTPKAHNGCKKFVARFGADALAFVADKELRPRNLRGIYLRTVESGAIAIGDAIERLS